jgi:hypothetical protein
MTTMLKRILATLAALTLAACGGGGGGSGTPPFGPGGPTDPTNPGTTPAYNVTVSLSSQTVTAAQPATVTARVASRLGTPVGSQVVTFGSSTGLGSFSATTALTDSNGVATVTLSPATASSVGADTVTASATIDGTTFAGSVGFQLTATNVTISAFTAQPAGTLAAYGQTQLTVTLAGTSPSTPVNVAVSSACVTQGRATLTPASATTSTGSATFTYRDQGCGAFNTTDGLQASVTGTGATASTTLTLTAPTVASIAFVSAEPPEIFLRGSGFVENSNITFQVRDTSGQGVPNQTVTLDASTLAGGLLLDGGSSAVTKVTDSNGNVIVRINAGTVPTPVRVRATLSPSGASTFSSNLAIAVGLPSQQNFSLSQRTFNIEGLNVDGSPNTYTVIASDRLGNPVPDGTAINFIAEGGQVQAIRQTVITSGLSSATANFQSSTPKPADGRVTVLAYALGEESFLDVNGDNVYTPGEDYQDLGDVFLDRLFNGTYNSAEDQFVSLTLIQGSDPCRPGTSSLLSLGVDAPSRTLSHTGATLNTCVSGWGRAYVRKATQTVFSASATRLGWRQGSVDPQARSLGGSGTCSRLSLIDQIDTSPYAANDNATRVNFYLFGNSANVLFENMGKTGSIGVLVADANPVALNPAAAGTTVTAAATAGLSATVLGSPVPSTLVPSGAAINYSFDDTTFEGTITVTIRSPGGTASVYSQKIYRGSSGLVSGTCP